MTRIYLCVNKSGAEKAFDAKPIRVFNNKGFSRWELKQKDISLRRNSINLPKGSIEKLIGYKLTWKNEPVKYL